jgi:hypothetical protein
MNITKWILTGAVLLLTSPAWADNVYFGGFEDLINGDYDYNDLVFSLSGSDLTLHSTGTWFPEPALGTSGDPFWNNSSWDGPRYNIGYCIYGGGNCNGGSGLAPSDTYLATDTGGPVGDVFFSVSQSVGAPIYLHVAGFTDLLGWYPVGDPSAIHWINSSASQTGIFSFDPPVGDFGLVANNAGGFGGDTFYSQTGAGGTQDPFGSHFAFFGTIADPPPPAVPEPGSVILMGSALLGISVLLRRRNRQSAGQ